MRRSFFVIILVASSPAIFGQTIANVPYLEGEAVSMSHFDCWIGRSAANRGMPKIESISISGTGDGVVQLSTTEKWPAGTWSTGYHSWFSTNDFVKQLNYFGSYWGSHPLGRMNSKMIRAHIHTNRLFPSYSPAANINKIKAGIGYMIGSQVKYPTEGPDNNYAYGGFISWASRHSQFVPNTDESPGANMTHSLETSQALRALSEAYLYLENHDIPYDSMDLLAGAIMDAGDNLLQKGPAGSDLSNSNYKAFAAWGLASAYKVTRLTKYLDGAIDLCDTLMALQITDGGYGDGMWPTGLSHDEFDGCGDSVMHDSRINYHLIILRGLVETMDIIPNTPTYQSTRAQLIASVKKAVNHVINYRVAYRDYLFDNGDGTFEDVKIGKLRGTWLTVNGDTTCNKSAWAYYHYDEPIEPIAMLALYSKFHPEFSIAEQDNLKRLLLVMSRGSVWCPTDFGYGGYFTTYAYYADYLDVIEKPQGIFPENEHDCPSYVNLQFSTPHGMNTFFEAQNDIYSSASINSGVTITYAPGHEIVLTDGFEALQGSEFAGFIYPCHDGSSSAMRIGNSGQETNITSTEKVVGEVNKNNTAFSTYPNPFNQTINIAYKTEKPGKVVIFIYDPLNNQSIVVANGIQDAGQHTTTFNADKLGSGIYFCTIRAGELVKTEKIVLMK